MIRSGLVLAAALVALTPRASLAQSTNTTFSGDHAAVLAGNGFSASTGMQSVSSGNYLNARLSNGSATATCDVILRRASNASTSALIYYSGNNPAALSSPTTVTPGNRYVGGPNNVASSASFSWNMGTTAAVPSTSPSDVIPAGGSDSVTVEKLVGPGQSIGLTIGGAGGTLSSAATLGITFAWNGC